MSVIAPTHALSIASVHPSDVEHQDILDEIPCTIYGEKFPDKISEKIPDDISLTLQNEIFLEKTHGNSNGENTW